MNKCQYHNQDLPCSKCEEIRKKAEEWIKKDPQQTFFCASRTCTAQCSNCAEEEKEFCKQK